MKSPEYEKFENETGKKAIWRGNVTKNFRKWEEGEKIYSRDKQRISFYIDEKEKQKWKQFIEQNPQYKNYSSLVRRTVRNFIKGDNGAFRFQINNNDQDFTNFTHQIKDELTVIKGNTEFIIQEQNLGLHDSLYEKLSLIIKSCHSIETKITNLRQSNEYDILIVEDKEPTIRLLKEFYKSYDIKCKGVLTGSEALKELQRNQPKVILLDIMLTDKNGIEVYDIIRENPKYDAIRIYIITAFTKESLTEILGERKVEGCFFKPFNLSELETITYLFRKGD